MPGELSLTSSLVAVRGQVSCDLADEAVVLSLKDGVYYSLNPVGAMIWRLLQEPRTVQQIRDEILKVYPVEPSRCERELLALLHQILEWDLAEVYSVPGV